MADWSVLNRADPSPGDPQATASLGQLLLNEAGAVDALVDRQTSVASAVADLRMAGDYAGSYADVIRTLPGDLSRLGHAYRQCGSALTAFAGDLLAAKSLAASALQEGMDAVLRYRIAVRQLSLLMPGSAVVVSGSRLALSAMQIEVASAGLDQNTREQIRSVASQACAADADRAYAASRAEQAAGLFTDAEDRCVRSIQQALCDSGIANPSWLSRTWHTVESGPATAVGDAGPVIERLTDTGFGVGADALASLAQAAVHDPVALGETAAGSALTVLGTGGEIGGGLLDLTGVGAPMGLALNAASAEVIVAGAGLTAVGAGQLLTNAFGPDRVDVYESRATDTGGSVSPPDGDDISGDSEARTYETSPKHGSQPRRNIQKAPEDGQAALDGSVQVSPNSTRRIGVDVEHDEIVVFDETQPGQSVFHGHVRTWDQLTPKMRAQLIKDGLVDRRGRIQP